MALPARPLTSIGTRERTCLPDGKEEGRTSEKVSVQGASIGALPSRDQRKADTPSSSLTEPQIASPSRRIAVVADSFEPAPPDAARGPRTLSTGLSASRSILYSLVSRVTFPIVSSAIKVTLADPPFTLPESNSLAK